MGLIKYLFGKSIKQIVKEAIVEVVKEEQDQVDHFNETIEEIKEYIKPVLNIKAILSNNTLTVLLPSGEFVISYEGSKELLAKVQQCQTEEEAKDLLMPEIKKKKEEAEVAVKKEAERLEREANKGSEITVAQKATVDAHSQSLLDSEDFEEIDGGIFLKGIKVPIPPLMLFKFAELAQNIEKYIYDEDAEISDDDYIKFEDEYQALKNFWMWCVLCPSVNSRKQLFQFLKNHDLKINKNGFFFAYRRVVTVHGKENDAKKVAYITSEYLRIKVKNKKAPSKYIILMDRNGDFSTVKGKDDQALPIAEGYEMVGNVRDLFHDIANLQENVYTDNATRTFDIRLGKEVSMPRENCDDNPYADCSTGLHIGSKEFGFGGFGDTHILVLVNPMNSVSVPAHYTSKMRVSAYLPVAVISNTEEQTTFLEDADVFELGESYFQGQVASIEEKAKEVAAENPDPAEVKEIEVAKVVIIEVLKEQVIDIREALKGRVVKI